MNVTSASNAFNPSSPIFRRNELVCKAWESFVTTNQGTIQGEYNDDVYGLQGTIPGTRDWSFSVTRSVESSRKLLRPGHETIVESITLQTILPENHVDFSVHKSAPIDILKRDTHLVKDHMNYAYICDEELPKFLICIMNALSEAIQDNLIHRIDCEGSVLKIVLLDANETPEIIADLLKMK